MTHLLSPFVQNFFFDSRKVISYYKNIKEYTNFRKEKLKQSLKPEICKNLCFKLPPGRAQEFNRQALITYVQGPQSWTNYSNENCRLYMLSHCYYNAAH